MISRARAIKEIKKLFKDNKIKCYFVKSLPYGFVGFAAWPNIVWIYKKQTASGLLSTAYHELCHILNYREGKYPIYHSKSGYRRNRKGYIATAYRAELYTDKRAEKMMNQDYPDIMYVQSYRTEESRQLLLKHIKGKC